jgi:hypothetical protein
MSEPQSGSAGQQNKLLTLSEVSRRTRISMPTLQRYKKTYQQRIPSFGTGRKQRYPEHALAVFEQLKSENAKRRGRPRKNAVSEPRPVAARGRRGAPARRRPGRPRRVGRPPLRRAGARRGPGRPPRGAAPRAKRGGLLTLTQIGKTTGISYPTLVRYVRLYSDRLPHEGEGRKRRFYPAAVPVFRELRAQSGRGGRRKRTAAGGRGSSPLGIEAMLRRQIEALEKSQMVLERKLRDFARSLQKMFT